MARAPIPWGTTRSGVVVIVVGVLVALGGDAWWDRSQDRKHLGDVLGRLESALTESLSLIDRNLSLSEGDGVRLRRLLASGAPAEEPIPFDSTRMFLQALWRPNTYPNNVALINSLLNDESLRLFTDLGLQEAAVSWREEAEDVEERGRQLVVAERDVLQALARHEEVGRMLMGVVDGVGPTALRLVREDREVRTVRARKEAHARVQRLRLGLLRERAEALLELVRSAQSH